MSKEFEDYIKVNRNQLDDVEQVDELPVWQNIQSELPATNNSNHHSNFRYFWLGGVAASVLFLLGFGYYLWQQPASPTQLEDFQLANVAPDLEEEETNYKKIISEKTGAIQLDKINPEDYKDIFLELQLLEEIHQEYRKDLSAFGHQDQLVKTLIKYYERKIRILERLSKEIEIKEYNNEKLRKENKL